MITYVNPDAIEDQSIDWSKLKNAPFDYVIHNNWIQVDNTTILMNLDVGYSTIYFIDNTAHTITEMYDGDTYTIIVDGDELPIYFEQTEVSVDLDGIPSSTAIQYLNNCYVATDVKKINPIVLPNCKLVGSNTVTSESTEESDHVVTVAGGLHTHDVSHGHHTSIVGSLSDGCLTITVATADATINTGDPDELFEVPTMLHKHYVTPKGDIIYQ